jgi:c-di-GMP-binding flagellar brake protein YcgR
MDVSGSNRRRFKRVNVQLAATLRVNGGEEHKAQIRNISRGGALVYCADPIAAVGQVLYVTINFKDSDLELKAKVSDRGAVELNIDDDEPDKSVIRWVGSDQTFGIQFMDVKPEKESHLAQLVEVLATKFGWDE